MWVYLYMGVSPSSGAPTDAESGCGPWPQATRQRTDLSPSPPAGRPTSWRNPRLKPRTPELKTMCLPSVRPSTTHFCTIICKYNVNIGLAGCQKHDFKSCPMSVRCVNIHSADQWLFKLYWFKCTGTVILLLYTHYTQLNSHLPSSCEGC